MYFHPLHLLACFRSTVHIKTALLPGYYGYGELFDEARYGRALRLATDYIYALVQVEGDEEPVWYLSDDADIKDGDYVTVPGKESSEATGRIQQIVYGPRAEAPDDFESMRRILSTPGSRATAPSARSGR